MPIRKAVSPALFAVVVICFFLPFFTVACTAGEELAGLGEQLGGNFQLPPSEDLDVSVTGFDIVTGGSGEETEQLGEAAEQPAAPRDDGGGAGQIFAIVALGVAVLGIGLSLLRGQLGPILATVLGLAGAIVLVLLRNEVTGQIPPQAAAFIEVRTELGFWLALLLFLAAAGWGLYRVLTERTAVGTQTGATGFEAAPTAPPGAKPPFP